MCKPQCVVASTLHVNIYLFFIPCKEIRALYINNVTITVTCEVISHPKFDYEDNISLESYEDAKYTKLEVDELKGNLG